MKVGTSNLNNYCQTWTLFKTILHAVFTELIIRDVHVLYYWSRFVRDSVMHAAPLRVPPARNNHMFPSLQSLIAFIQ
jgi:hypothetical protein